MFHLQMPVQKFGGLPPKILGAKNANFGLIMDRDIPNRKTI